MASNCVHNLITFHPGVSKPQYTGGYKEQTESPLHYAHCAQSAQYGFHYTLHKAETLKTLYLHKVLEQ
jgi:hypothetical protein